MTVKFSKKHTCFIDTGYFADTKHAIDYYLNGKFAGSDSDKYSIRPICPHHRRKRVVK